MFFLSVTAIEACRQQLSGTTTEYNLNGHSECSEQTTSTDGPVLEEFIPIKKRASPENCDEDEDDEEDEQHSHRHKISKDSSKNSDKRKSDWLRSVQLWNPEPSSTEEVKKQKKKNLIIFLFRKKKNMGTSDQLTYVVYLCVIAVEICSGCE